MLSERVRGSVGVDVFLLCLLLLRGSSGLFLLSQCGELSGAECRDIVCMVSDVWITKNGTAENIPPLYICNQWFCSTNAARQLMWFERRGDLEGCIGSYKQCIGSY